MFGLIGLLLPLLIGALIAYPLGRRVNALGQRVPLGKGGERLRFLRMLGESLAAISGLAILLAFLFADFMDTLDGEASFEQLMGYAKFQAILLSILSIPAALFGYWDGKAARL